MSFFRIKSPSDDALSGKRFQNNSLHPIDAMRLMTQFKEEVAKQGGKRYLEPTFQLLDSNQLQNSLRAVDQQIALSMADSLNSSATASEAATTTAIVPAGVLPLNNTGVLASTSTDSTSVHSSSTTIPDPPTSAPPFDVSKLDQSLVKYSAHLRAQLRDAIEEEGKEQKICSRLLGTLLSMCEHQAVEDFHNLQTLLNKEGRHLHVQLRRQIQQIEENNRGDMATVRAYMFDQLQLRHVAFNTTELTWVINWLDKWQGLIIEHWNRWFRTGDPPFAWEKLAILLKERMSETNSSPLWLELRKAIKDVTTAEGPTTEAEAQQYQAKQLGAKGDTNVWSQLKKRLYMIMAQDVRSLDTQPGQVGTKRSGEYAAMATTADVESEVLRAQEEVNAATAMSEDSDSVVCAAVWGGGEQRRYKPQGSSSSSSGGGSSSSSGGGSGRNSNPNYVYDVNNRGVCYAFKRGGTDPARGGCTRGAACKFSHEYKSEGGATEGK